jgi:hypothetical protein
LRQCGGLTNERFPKGEIEMRWPRIRTEGRGERAPSEFAPRMRVLIIGDTWILETSCGNPVQVSLINCLRCTDALQFGWTIGGAHEHGYTRLMGLNHSGMKLHRSGS